MEPVIDRNDLNLWELDGENRPIDEDQFFQLIAPLQNPAWVAEFQEEAKSRFILLADTNLSNTPFLIQAREFQVYLVKAYPHLFPTIKIRIKTEDKIKTEEKKSVAKKTEEKKSVAEMNIPKNLLIEKGRNLKIIFADRWGGKEKKELEFVVPKGFDEKTARAFLHYLSTGNIEFTEVNVLALLQLAREYELSDLSALCLECLLDNLEFSHFKDVLKDSIQFNDADLQWICLIFASQNSRTEEFGNYQRMMETPDGSSDASPSERELGLLVMSILKNGKECNDSGIIPSFGGERNTRTVSLNKTHFNHKVLEDLSPLIEGLNIQDYQLTNNDLENLTKVIINLHFLYIRSDRLEIIPASWARTLKEIDCCGCGALETLDAPAAEKINCSACFVLTTLRAQAAEKIYCNNCHALRTLVAPAAKVINCRFCLALTILDAPAAEKIYCNSCDALRTLYAPVAKMINCRLCRSLTSIHAPGVKKINCRLCRVLSTLHAVVVKEIDCYGCPSLTTSSLEKT